MITVYPEGRGGFRWILRDDVEVITKSPIFTNARSAVEAARDFKLAVAAAQIEHEEKPWWQHHPSRQQ